MEDRVIGHDIMYDIISDATYTNEYDLYTHAVGYGIRYDTLSYITYCCIVYCMILSAIFFLHCILWDIVFQ